MRSRVFPVSGTTIKVELPGPRTKPLAGIDKSVNSASKMVLQLKIQSFIHSFLNFCPMPGKTKIFECSNRPRMPSKYYDCLFPTESPPKSLQSFTYFPKLPPEVQAMIWKTAAADDKSRIVEFFIKKDEARQERELSIHHQPPALLHVNHQAQKWTIKYLQAFLGKEDCFIDPEKDVVFMEDSIVPKVYASWIQDEISRYRPEVELIIFIIRNYIKI